MTTPPPESPIPVVAPTVEETRAINNSFSDEEIKALAQMILKSGELGFDPTTIKKGVITAVNLAGSPPTVSIEISGESSVSVSSVRILDTYSPLVGHTVLIAKQGPDIVILGHVADLSAYSTSGGAGGWTKATLAGGSHGGHSNGDVCFRRVLDNGSWKMQWRGGWNASGTTVISSLSSDFRPSSRRSLSAARDATNRLSVRVDFETDGSVVIVGGTTSTGTANINGDVLFANTSGSADFIDLSHNHLGDSGGVTGVTGLGHSHGVLVGHDHGFSGGSHSHPVATPAWVSFNGLEYFL